MSLIRTCVILNFLSQITQKVSNMHSYTLAKDRHIHQYRSECIKYFQPSGEIWKNDGDIV